MSKTFFAYHLTHVFGKFALDTYHTNSTKPAEGDLVYVLSGDKDPDDPGVDYWLEGLFRIHRRIRGPWTLKGINGAVRPYEFRLSMSPVRRLDLPVALRLADWYSREEAHRFFSSGQNFNPLPTKPDYKTRFDELLAGYGSNEATDLLLDLAELAQDESGETQYEVLAKARIGQGKFRADLVAAWRRGEVCALTGLAVPEMLIASHIKPWRESSNMERLDPMNGLLLAAHIDKLFDRFLLSFVDSRDGLSSVLHPRIRLDVVSLGLRDGMLLNTTHVSLRDEDRLKSYMAYHLKRHRVLVERDAPVS